MVPMGISRKVAKRVVAEFEANEVDHAREILSSIHDIGAFNTSMNRVQLAIIKLANGDLTELERMSIAANADWRDVLYWADYPPDAPRTWTEVKAKLNLPPGTDIEGDPEPDAI
jgi:hypothetical protein